VELILIRHGLPLRVENAEGVPADPELSEHGHEQARRMSRFLSGESFDALYASPMRRAFQTALPLAAETGHEIRVEPGVVEFDGDSNVYIPLEELKESDYDRWRQMMEEGVYGLDMLRTFQKGVVETLERIVSEHRGQRIAVVCHGGVINAWAGHVLSVDNPMFFQPEYTSVNRFLAASSGERTLVTLNEFTHLRD